MGPKKKKKLNTANSELRTCVIHFDDCNEDNFTPLNEERLRKIKDVAAIRQSQPQGSSEKLDTVCSNIPTMFEANDGYHRDRYKKFTRNVNRIHSPIKNTKNEVPSKPKRNKKRRRREHIFQE